MANQELVEFIKNKVHLLKQLRHNRKMISLVSNVMALMN